MASVPYKDIVASRPIKFLIGPEKKEYTIHSSLVACQSPALYSLVNGEWKEAKEQCVVWEHCDEDAFHRFSQFVYTGDYDAPEPRKRMVEQPKPLPEYADTPPVDETAEAPADERPGEVVPFPVKKKPKKPVVFPSIAPSLISGKQVLWNKLNLLYPEPVATNATNAANEPDDDYTDVFLSHALMYVFADYHGISDLQGLAFRKLRTALMQHTLYQEGVRDIVQLLKYCFNNTANKGEQRDPLRTMVCIYSAYKMEDMWQNEEFRGLVDTLGEFPSSLLTELMHRVK